MDRPGLDPDTGRGLSRLRQTVLDDIPAQAVPQALAP